MQIQFKYKALVDILQPISPKTDNICPKIQMT